MALCACGPSPQDRARAEAAKAEQQAKAEAKAEVDRKAAETRKIIGDAQARVRKLLKDPDAAKFRMGAYADVGVEGGKSIRVVCGYLNAKNSYGGYIGESYWYTFDFWTGDGGVCLKLTECDWALVPAANEGAVACTDSLGG